MDDHHSGDEVAYFSQDFDWNELREEIESASGCQDSKEERQDGTFLLENQICCQTAWEKFHRRHAEGIFFKERRYLLKEFPELGDPDRNFVLLEIGCGAGSSIVPILRTTKARVFACDLSQTALDITNKMAKKALAADQPTSRLRTFLCDPSTETLPTWLACPDCRLSNFTTNCTPISSSCCERGVDCITLIFTLSALPSNQMENLLKECYAVLRPGGMIFFRDYGLYDMTMLRFPQEQKVAEVCYRRLDGTLSYFFSCEVARSLFLAAGFVEMELQYCCIKLINRRKNLPMKRVWIHAKFIKPAVGSNKDKPL